MLAELRVEDLGIVDELNLTLPDGLVAITGETGAGKTLIVTALELLVGGRADAGVVRDGASEARVEGRFVGGDDELVLARVVPRTGRSRAYVNGRLATAAQLEELGRDLVDLHGQHSHQSLLAPGEQRRTLDRFAGAEALDCLLALRAAADELVSIDGALDALGGDPRARAREVDLLAFQIAEIEAAAVDDPDEDGRLAAEEALLSEADAHREALERGYEALTSGADDHVGRAVSALSGRTPFSALEARLRELHEQLGETARDLRNELDTVIVDPARLDEVRVRRATLAELRRKYGETLADVVDFLGDARARLSDLERDTGARDALTARRAEVEGHREATARALTRIRRAAAPPFGDAVTARLRELAMPRASFDVSIDEASMGTDGIDDVVFRLAPNPGEAARPLAKAASGGELSRTMLAIRVVLSEAPPTLVFDEVDAGVGGEVGSAVGDALASLGARHQVLVVTHLAQVAACADAQIVVTKALVGGRTVARAEAVAEEDRVEELSRMLAGEPSSASAQDHARELLMARRR